MFRSQTLVLTALLFLGACAQGRRNSSAGSYEIWGTQELCTNTSLACFDVSLNITKDEATFEVTQLPGGYDGTPFRVWARPYDENSFYLLADNVVASTGEMFDVVAYGNHAISDYDEWRVEMTENYVNGLLAPAEPFQGLILVQGLIEWPELNL